MSACRDKQRCPSSDWHAAAAPVAAAAAATTADDWSNDRSDTSTESAEDSDNHRDLESNTCNDFVIASSCRHTINDLTNNNDFCASRQLELVTNRFFAPWSVLLPCIKLYPSPPPAVAVNNGKVLEENYYVTVYLKTTSTPRDGHSPVHIPNSSWPLDTPHTFRLRSNFYPRRLTFPYINPLGRLARLPVRTFVPYTVLGINPN